jgi:hypothetical protein
MSQERRGVRIRNATITFNMPKAQSLSSGLSQIYTIGPWLYFAASDKVRELAARIENDIWVETLDGLPPETLLLVEHGSTMRVAIDIGENTRKETVKRAFDLAKKWQEVIRDLQGYRVDNEKDAFFANLEQMRKRSSYAKVAERFNKFVSEQLGIAWGLFVERNNHQTLSEQWVISDTNAHKIINLTRKMLEYLMSEETVDNLLREAFERIGEGLAPFEAEYPLSKYDLKENYLKDWRRRTGGRLHEDGGGKK